MRKHLKQLAYQSVSQSLSCHSEPFPTLPKPYQTKPKSYKTLTKPLPNLYQSLTKLYQTQILTKIYLNTTKHEPNPLQHLLSQVQPKQTYQIQPESGCQTLIEPLTNPNKPLPIHNKPLMSEIPIHFNPIHFNPIH